MFDFISFGTATRDVFLTGAAFRALKDKEHLQGAGFPTGEAECFALGAKIEIAEPIFTIGGGATNAAVTAARMGLKATAICRLGKDELGVVVRQTMQREGVRLRAAYDAKKGTAYSTILLTDTGERTILVYRGASEDMEERDVPFGALKARWLYVVPGALSPTLVMKVIETAKRAGTKVAMNPSGHYLAQGEEVMRPFFALLDLVVVNREEAASVTNTAFEDARGIFKKFDALVPGIAVVTDGPRGALVSDGTRLYRAPIFPETRVLDRTGAGDAFGSGFTAAFAHGADITEALRIASANATSVVEWVGAQPGILHASDYGMGRWRQFQVKTEAL